MLILARLAWARLLRQPATWIAAGGTLLLIAASLFFGMFNFELQDRVRMLATAGVAAVALNGVLLAAFGAAASVHEEFAQRTALPLLAGPVSRGQLLAGKALGAWLAAATLAVPLVAAHLLALWLGWRRGFEFDLPAARGFDAKVVVPYAAVLCGHALALMQVAALACLATALAVRLPLALAVAGTAAAFVCGHLLAGGGIAGFGLVPALGLFSADDAMQGLARLPDVTDVAGAGLYTALFGAGCLVIGVALLRRQDIP
jgi:ABC-type transport system involved in multi-copper enzyme maturation permease subunit